MRQNTCAVFPELGWQSLPFCLMIAMPGEKAEGAMAVTKKGDTGKTFVFVFARMARTWMKKATFGDVLTTVAPSQISPLVSCNANEHPAAATSAKFWKNGACVVCLLRQPSPCKAKKWQINSVKGKSDQNTCAVFPELG